eukprot:NODE_1979_length_2319_cov_8.143248.p1 GENE.NODE_1979_length_2319_cov_8.143248~~NODE_1979_length_2319_cov_8.143248.p1  ORF type:complete len:547 (+),score=67.16 NODE_1979_length_2319_cov_8.143248:214-1854(+)
MGVACHPMVPHSCCHQDAANSHGNPQTRVLHSLEVPFKHIPDCNACEMADATCMPTHDASTWPFSNPTHSDSGRDVNDGSSEVFGAKLHAGPVVYMRPGDGYEEMLLTFYDRGFRLEPLPSGCDRLVKSSIPLVHAVSHSCPLGDPVAEDVTEKLCLSGNAPSSSSRYDHGGSVGVVTGEWSPFTVLEKRILQSSSRSRILRGFALKFVGRYEDDVRHSFMLAGSDMEAARARSQWIRVGVRALAAVACALFNDSTASLRVPPEPAKMPMVAKCLMRGLLLLCDALGKVSLHYCEILAYARFNTKLVIFMEDAGRRVKAAVQLMESTSVVIYRGAYANTFRINLLLLCARSREERTLWLHTLGTILTKLPGGDIERWLPHSGDTRSLSSPSKGDGASLSETPAATVATSEVVVGTSYRVVSLRPPLLSWTNSGVHDTPAPPAGDEPSVQICLDQMPSKATDVSPHRSGTSPPVPQPTPAFHPLFDVWEPVISPAPSAPARSLSPDPGDASMVPVGLPTPDDDYDEPSTPILSPTITGCRPRTAAAT